MAPEDRSAAAAHLRDSVRLLVASWDALEAASGLLKYPHIQIQRIFGLAADCDTPEDARKLTDQALLDAIEAKPTPTTYRPFGLTRTIE